MSDRGSVIKVLIQLRDLRIGNGIAACIMNYFESTAKQGYQIDFLLSRNIKSPNLETVKQYGCNIFVLPHDFSKPNKENAEFIEEIVGRGYNVIHVNISGLNALIALFYAKKFGVSARIYHAHNPREISSAKAYIRSLVYEIPSVWFANQYVACSNHAGDSIFKGKKYTVLRNAMNVQNYQYNAEKRNKLRSEMQIDKNLVIGTVGRLAEQKNPYFAIDVFCEFKKLRSDAILIWVGDGPLMDELRVYARKKNVDAMVRFLGTRNDVNYLYSAMDVFLLPSRFEGLGLVFIEAQIAGLNCFGSDQVPKDTHISELMHFISLKENAANWAKQILECKQVDNRSCYVDKAMDAGYDINRQFMALCDLYSGMEKYESGGAK